MRTQLCSIKTFKGTWKVFYDDSVKRNPYRVYIVTYGPNKYGYTTKHQKQIARYADYESCFHLFAQQMSGYEWIRTDRTVEPLV